MRTQSGDGEVREAGRGRRVVAGAPAEDLALDARGRQHQHAPAPLYAHICVSRTLTKHLGFVSVVSVVSDVGRSVEHSFFRSSQSLARLSLHKDTLSKTNFVVTHSEPRKRRALKARSGSKAHADTSTESLRTLP